MLSTDKKIPMNINDWNGTETDCLLYNMNISITILISYIIRQFSSIIVISNLE